MGITGARTRTQRQLTTIFLTGWVIVLLCALPSEALASPPAFPSPLSQFSSPAAGSPASPKAAVSSLTGIPEANLADKSVCPAQRPGHATCQARLWVLRGTSTPVRARVLRDAGPTAVVRPRAQALTRAQTTGQAPPQMFTPSWLQAAYDLTYLSATAGGGRTVAIVDAWDDPTAASDLATYRSHFGLPACTIASGCLSIVNQSGATSPLPSSPPAGYTSWQLEESLDLDAVSAACPNCKIILVEASSDSWSDLQTADAEAAALGTNAISDSWAGTQSSPPTGQFTFPGVATVAATGDGGTLQSGEDNYPAALPDVTAAGGTMLRTEGGSPPRGFSETVWGFGGSGCDLQESKPAWQSDTGCSGRSYADISAQADGMLVYSSSYSGWVTAAGTSESTPLVAAYYALTGAGASTPAWDYQHAADLNDIVSGWNDAILGSCAVSYICNAGPGYDGPSGVGSISGQVATGAPGIGAPDASINHDYASYIDWQSATVSGGIYPNGLDTVYWWEYGTTTSYGQSTSRSDIGTGSLPQETTPVTISGLSPGTTYHYRLVAQNALGTTYGYDYTFTTASGVSKPVAQQPPGVSGVPEPTWTLTADSGTWLPTGSQPPTLQWYVSSDGVSWTKLDGATGDSYSLTKADDGNYYEVSATETNSQGTTTATSNTIGPITDPGAPLSEVGPRILSPVNYRAAAPIVGTEVYTDSGIWFDGGMNGGDPTHTYQWLDCAPHGSCTPIPGATSAGYAIQSSDAGQMLEVSVTASDRYGTSQESSAPIGPVVAGPATVSSLKMPVPPIGTNTWHVAAIASPATATLSYQWQRSADCGATWTDIPGANKSSYTPTGADATALLHVMVTATDANGSETIPSGYAPPSMTVLPWAYRSIVVMPNIQIGDRLELPYGDWCTAASGLYGVAGTWQTNTGTGWQVAANGFSFSPVTTPGVQVRALEYIKNINGWSVAASQTWTGGSPLSARPPVIDGTPVDGGGVLAAPGQTLNATPGTWSSSTAVDSTSYQWQYSPDSGWQIGGDTGGTWFDIPGATGTSLAVTSRYSTDPIRVVESATNSYGTTEVASTQTWPVSGATWAAQPAAPTPKVSGSTAAGGELTAKPSAWDPAATTTSYQWQYSLDGGASWKDIPGATADSYRVDPAYVGDLIRFTQMGSNLGRVTRVASSAVGSATTAATTTAATTTATTTTATTTTATTTTTTTATTTTATTTGTSRGRPGFVKRPRLHGKAAVGRVLRLRGGRYSHTKRVTVRFERCRQRCVKLGSGRSLRIPSAAAGEFVTAVITLHGPGGTSTKRIRSRAPVISGAVGATRISRSGRFELRASGGSILARGTTAEVRGRRLDTFRASLVRSRSNGERVRVWVYVTHRGRHVRAASWSTRHSRLSLSRTVSPGTRVELVLRAR